MKQSWKIISGRIAIACMLGLSLIFFVACGLSGEGGSSAQATPTPLPTPVVPDKPVYAVEQGTVVKTLEFTGRVSPVLEQELFFKTDGFVGEVYFARGDRLEAGELLAELEIGDLQNRLAQQQVALETAELTLSKAKQTIADQQLEAEINLEKLQLQLEQDQAEPDIARVTSAQVNLLDQDNLPTETNVNMTFYDLLSGKVRHNFVHTMNHKGNPDTLFLDPLISYWLEIHTIPPIIIDTVRVTAGKHTIIAANALARIQCSPSTFTF